MTNLLKETEKDMKWAKKTPDEIRWIGSHNGEYACTWSQFKELADFEYDCGFGTQKIACDLVIVFTDGTWFDRQEYDGSEGWYFQRVPTIGDTTKPINRLKDEYGYNSLHSLHEEMD